MSATAHWLGLTPDQRVASIQSLGLPAYRAAQINRHVFERLEADAHSFTDLPKPVRQLVGEHLLWQLLTPAATFKTDRGRTVKTAWRLSDGAVIESVLMRYPRRDTVCISSQAGCAMGCPFCATGQGGLRRSLEVAEIVAQVWLTAIELAANERPGRVGNVVLMGMGEPLANYERVVAAVRIITSAVPDGLGISARGVTISTVGLVTGIERLAREGLPVTLAVSLHAPDDLLRDELVPVNKRFRVAEVLDAAWEYAKVTKRRVSIEYALIRDVNDQPGRADQLARLLRSRGDWTWAHVNVIPLNPTPGSVWTAATPERQAEFVRHLEMGGVPVTIRDTRGRDIEGACGQLAAGSLSDPKADKSASS